MSQHDYLIDNQSGASFRADINGALAATVSLNSGPAEPATRYAYMLWADTTAGFLKQRNAANSAWITLWPLATGIANSPFSASFVSSQQTFTANSGLTIAHGLGVVPTMFELLLVCTTADVTFNVGDVVTLSSYYEPTGTRGVSVSADATNVYIGIRSVPSLIAKNGSGANAITATSWRMVVRAYK